ncbi:ABC transporter ATP-binding protein [Geodermatophilus sp. DSM 44513]|uniref:ABC transporter ATP-binding protein n=1 Tax=Geodermatophilus sp. DSM 44513 TaxID=1528104 RepID=UPI00126D660D|nr:ABC transporter ATP-binding protein [Geodermatophilus sp. DSM 44513]WNV76956.1 ABC transporter ATP-binding protein [Geodermatophilus sp. DSM 44513]
MPGTAPLSPLLDVRDLSVSAAGRELVSGVGFTVRAGERVAVVGESGSGKTLTVSALLGLLPPGVHAAGSVTVDGVEVVGTPESRLRPLRGRVTALVPQDPGTSLSPLSRVGRQVAEPLRAQGHSRRAARARAVELLGQVRLPDPPALARRHPAQLSGGQRQRVAIAMALAGGPRLLVADEPTSALDVTVQAGVLDVLRRVTDERGTALLLITHDLAVATSVCDRVLVLRSGRLLADGPPAAVLSARDPYLSELVTAARETSLVAA